MMSSAVSSPIPYIERSRSLNSDNSSLKRPVSVPLNSVVMTLAKALSFFALVL